MTRRIRPLLTILGAIAGLFAWDGVAGVWTHEHPGLSELSGFMIAKIGASLLAAVLLLATGWLRKVGLVRPLALRQWALLWPLWLDAGLSMLQGLTLSGYDQILGWLAVSVGIGFSEEVVFRGVAMTALRILSPRANVLISASVFGACHLVNALSIDWRVATAQALAAAGLGLVLGAVRLRAGSLWPGIIAHSALDFCGIAAAGGVGAALDYNPGFVIYLLGMGAIAAIWGLVVLGQFERLPIPVR
jgi:membrane protease YdiL (CAAX protease family)